MQQLEQPVNGSNWGTVESMVCLVALLGVTVDLQEAGYGVQRLCQAIMVPRPSSYWPDSGSGITIHER